MRKKRRKGVKIMPKNEMQETNEAMRLLESAYLRRRVQKVPGEEAPPEAIDFVLQIHSLTVTGAQALKLLDILDRAAIEAGAVMGW